MTDCPKCGGPLMPQWGCRVKSGTGTYVHFDICEQCDYQSEDVPDSPQFRIEVYVDPFFTSYTPQKYRKSKWWERVFLKKEKYDWFPFVKDLEGFYTWFYDEKTALDWIRREKGEVETKYIYLEDGK